ncbi:hypothetical protein [uncultured Clostridium sp.]|uniref:hypothetical protein n=1 Tax=uncultured Clostridium sp. TaxID=59620 RepID=UPI002614A3F3|nr:hypothetical protein [uncultured Clostridium sp.]
MSWYYGKFSCGCEGRVNVIGPEKYRQYKIDKAFEKVCESCYGKQIKEMNEKAALEAKEMELPELKGTDKQIAWANTLRQQLIESFETLRKTLIKANKETDTLENVLDYILRNKIKASFYIDRRNSSVLSIIEAFKEPADPLTQQIINECTVCPVEVKHDGIVEIKANEEIIEVSYENNEEFKNLVRKLGYRWNFKFWVREISETTGSYEDRAAELGNKLLNEGFVVSIQEKEIREKAVNGEFEKECKRWIYARSNKKLAIVWKGRSDSLYNASRKIPSARWEDRAMTVNVSKYKELEEFAEMYDFRFTKASRRLIDSYIEDFKNINKVVPKKVEETILKDGLNDILNSSREIISDLLEEE